MKSSRIPKYALHKPSGRAVVYVNRTKPVYLGVYGSEDSRRRYDEIIQSLMKERARDAGAAVAPPPSLRLHAADGRSVVTLNGQDIYCGEYGTPESVEKYNRLIATWLAEGRQGPSALTADGAVLTIIELLARFMRYAIAEYPDSNEASNYKYAIKPLKRLYGTLPAPEFSPKKLSLVREQMISKGWKRKNINKQVNRLRAVFGWGVSEELVPATVWESLRSLKPLRKNGRADVREGDPVLPVAAERVSATLPFVGRQVTALIQLQNLTGARAGELVPLRGIDIDTSKEDWVARPKQHKNAHRGQTREIQFGPQAQEVLKPFLVGRDPAAYLFSPAEAEAERRAKQRSARKTKVQPSQLLRAERAKTRQRKRPFGDRFTVNSYRHAIARACERAFGMPDEIRVCRGDSVEQKREKREKQSEWRRINVWHPHQLRHTVGTRVTSDFGLDAARAVLGQKHLGTTLIYAELDREKAVAVMKKVG